MFIRLKRWWLSVFGFLLQPREYTQPACVHTHTQTCTETPQLTHRGVQTFLRTTVPWYIPEPKLWLFLCLGVYMLRCGGQRLKLGVSPSSMLPYLFEAVHLTEPREDQCASLVGQNAQGSVFSLISLDMSLCVQLLYGHWRSTLKFSCLHGGDFANWAIHQDSELRATFTGMKRSTRYRPSLSNTVTCSRRHTWLAHDSQTSGPT